MRKEFIDEIYDTVNAEIKRRGLKDVDELLIQLENERAINNIGGKEHEHI